MNKSSRGGRRNPAPSNINVSDLMTSLGNIPEKPDTTPRTGTPSTPKSSRSRVSQSSGSDVSAMMAALSGGIGDVPLTPTSAGLSTNDRNKRRLSSQSFQSAATTTLSTNTSNTTNAPLTVALEEEIVPLKREYSWKERMANVKKANELKKEARKNTREELKIKKKKEEIVTEQMNKEEEQSDWEKRVRARKDRTTSQRSLSKRTLEPLIISEEEKKKDEEFLKSFNESDLTDADDDSTVLTLTDESTTLTLTELAPTVIHEEISLVLTEDAPLVLVEETVTLLSMDIKEDLQLTEELVLVEEVVTTTSVVIEQPITAPTPVPKATDTTTNEATIQAKVEAPVKSREDILKEIENEEKFTAGKKMEKPFRKTEFHELYKASNTIKELLKKTTTTEELLKLGNTTVIVAASKVEGKALVSFLCKVENIKTILAYLVKEPVLSANLTEDQVRFYKEELDMTDTSQQLLLQTPLLLKKIVSSAEFLGFFFRAMQNTLNFAVFARLVQLFTLLCVVAPKEVLTHIMTNEPNFVKAIVDKVGTCLVEDLLMTFRLIISAEKKAPGAVEWLLKNGLITKLLLLLRPNDDTQLSDSASLGRLEDAAFLLGELLSEQKLEADQGNSKNLFLPQFQDEQTMDTVFTNMFASKNVLVTAVSLFTSLIEGNIEGEDSIILLKFIENIAQFISILNEEDRQFVNLSTGKMPCLGQKRLAVFSLILALATAQPDVAPILIESGFYEIAVDHFFRYSTNNVLHEIVMQLVLLLCVGDNDDMMGVLVSTNLCDRLGDVWARFPASLLTTTTSANVSSLPQSLSIGRHEKSYFGYFGHVAIISNMIVDLADERSCVQELVSLSDQWQAGVGGKLDEYNSLMIASLTATATRS